MSLIWEKLRCVQTNVIYSKFLPCFKMQLLVWFGLVDQRISRRSLLLHLWCKNFIWQTTHSPLGLSLTYCIGWWNISWDLKLFLKFCCIAWLFWKMAAELKDCLFLEQNAIADILASPVFVLLASKHFFKESLRLSLKSPNSGPIRGEWQEYRWENAEMTWPTIFLYGFWTNEIDSAHSIFRGIRLPRSLDLGCLWVLSKLP